MRRLWLLPSAFLIIGLVGCDASEGQAITTKSATSRSAAMSSRVAARLAARSSVSSTLPAMFRPPASPPNNLKIPVLVYHHIRPTGAYSKATWSWKMSVSPATFEKHMQWIADRGYTTISLDMFTAIVRGEIAGPPKPIVITFDDNQLSQYTLGMPALEKRGQMAVFYFILNRMDTPSTMSREQVKEMASRGMDIQSHTMTHRVLTGLNDEELTWDLAESKRQLEELLGKPVLHVAYPGTAHNQRVRDATKAAGYTTATVMDPRTATEKDDLMKVPRIMMTDDTNLEKVLP